MIIEHIDKIARDKNRDILYITFDKEIYPSYEFEEYTQRNNIIKWLNDNDIPFKECGQIANESGWESYRGELYIDVPMDDENSKYKLLNNHLEYPDGTFKISGVNYMYLSLKIAMKNSHHDEPGFWENWADKF